MPCEHAIPMLSYVLSCCTPLHVSHQHGNEIGCVPIGCIPEQVATCQTVIKHSLTQKAAHTRRRARFASRAAALAAAASAGDSPLQAASDAAATAAALCPGGRGGLPAPGGFSVFRLHTESQKDAAGWPAS